MRRNHLTSAAIIAASTFAFAGCSPNSSAGKISSSPLKKYDKILKEYTKMLLETHYKKCGEDYVTYWKSPGQYLNTEGYLQLMNLDMTMKEDDLTEADKMNGMTISGKFRFGDNFMYRTYRAKSDLSYHDEKLGIWQDWHSPDPNFVTYWVNQKQGKWSFRYRTSHAGQGNSEDVPTFMSYDTLSKDINCEDLPRR